MKPKQAPQLPGQHGSTAIDSAPPNAYAQRLMEEFVLLLDAHRAAFKQTRSFARCVILALGMIFAFARHSVSQCVLSVGQGGRDWSAWYRLFSSQRYQQEDLDAILLGKMVEAVPVAEPFVVVVVDGMQTLHTSQRMPGCGLGISHRTPAYARGLHVCRRWVTCAWLPAIVKGFSRAIPVQFLPAFAPKSAPASAAPQTESQAALAFLSWLRACLDAMQRAMRRAIQRIVLLADGAFDSQEMWRGLPARVVMIVRTAKNRALFELPGATLGRGRPRLYGPQAPTPEAHLHMRTGWHSARIDVRGHARHLHYKLCGAYLRKDVPGQPVYLLVIHSYRWSSRDQAGRRVQRERKAAFYLISAVQRNGIWELPFPVHTILQWVWQRWEVEVTHRDMKAGLGVGQMQCWGQISSVMTTRWGVWVFALMLLAAYRAWGWHAPFALDCAGWHGAQRWSFNTVWRHFRIALWPLDPFRALAAHHGPTDPKIAACWLLLRDAVLAAARA